MEREREGGRREGGKGGACATHLITVNRICSHSSEPFENGRLSGSNPTSESNEVRPGSWVM